jgi:hypothetical protein
VPTFVENLLSPAMPGAARRFLEGCYGDRPDAIARRLRTGVGDLPPPPQELYGLQEIWPHTFVYASASRLDAPIQ